MRPASLRKAALTWMTILLTGVGAATMLIAYWLTLQEAREFLDGQLRQVALNAGVGFPGTEAPRPADRDPEDQIAVTIWRNDSVAHTDLPGVQIERPSRRGYADTLMAGERWRTYAIGNEVWTVQVAQRESVRQEYARSAAVGTAVPILIVIPLSWIVVGWAMNRMLGRLDGLARELADRSATAADPLPLAGVPTELTPLVESMNGLIVRLRAAVEFTEALSLRRRT